MSLCKPITTISTTYDCAKICAKWNDAPISKIKLGKNTLVQDCIFFDSGTVQNRLFKWTFKSKGYIFYESDWGSMNDFISEMNNNSTYGSIKLGFENVAIVNFINSLTSTLINTDDDVVVSLLTIDCDGVLSNAESNKYKFNKK